MMADMGAGGFAERARIELEATGGPARKRGTGTAAALTRGNPRSPASPAEASPTATSPRSYHPSTVDYHLRKVFGKLNLTSRTQLARSLRSASASSPEPRS